MVRRLVLTVLRHPGGRRTVPGRKWMIGVAAATLVAVVAAGTGSATTPVTVSLAECYFAGGGVATVPAGSDVTVQFGWASNKRGRVQDFISSQTTSATVDGNPIANAGSLWSPPESLGDLYVSWWSASAGTLANPGDGTVVTMQIALSHKIPAGSDPDTHKQLFAGPGDVLPAGFGCTITAV